jgi:hypothetical protein
MAALSVIWLLLLYLWPGSWLLCPLSGFCCFIYGPALGCFVHDVAFATLPRARLMAALSVIWLLLLYLWPGSWLLCP